MNRRRKASRKTTPKVRSGAVQKKNRHGLTELEDLLDGDRFSVVRMKPECGFRHVIRRKNALAFTALIPEWKAMSEGLSALVLQPEGCSEQTDINYAPRSYNSIWMPPFPTDMVLRWSPAFAEEHESMMQQLGVQIVGVSDDEVVTSWTTGQAEAWQLMHLFLYDLYCHHECIVQGGRDEYLHDHDEAEAYAVRTAGEILRDYEVVIGKEPNDDRPSSTRPFEKDATVSKPPDRHAAQLLVRKCLQIARPATPPKPAIVQQQEKSGGSARESNPAKRQSKPDARRGIASQRFDSWRSPPPYP